MKGSHNTVGFLGCYHSAFEVKKLRHKLTYVTKETCTNLGIKCRFFTPRCYLFRASMGMLWLLHQEKVI